jgi:hypothetical protein
VDIWGHGQYIRVTKSGAFYVDLKVINLPDKMDIEKVI